MYIGTLPESQRELYFRLLQACASLSRLFSTSDIPFLQYRVVENAFCRSFQAENLSRSDTAFDAQVGATGVGLKTFVCGKESSTEKVAEFNAVAAELRRLEGYHLARRVIELRNERIQLAQDIYGIDQALYHLVTRRPGEICLFDATYHQLDVEGISQVRATEAGVKFLLGGDAYTFNLSKSTLYRTFILPATASHLPVTLVDDPFELLLQLRQEVSESATHQPEREKLPSVILPLYSTGAKLYKEVPERSGLNQWNARGRRRSYGEVYIPIPSAVHRLCPGFFPPRDEPFQLKIPTGEVLSAKVCQSGGKALMTNPNDAMSDWLLRRLFRLQEGELLTRDHLLRLCFDSVRVTSLGMTEDGQRSYAIDKAPMDSYQTFLRDHRSGGGEGLS